MAMFRVSRKAAEDIRGIARYTQATWGVGQRRFYLGGMEEQFNLLSEAPELAAKRREFDPPVRIHRYGKHLIVYIEDEVGILIVRVLHERVDIDGYLLG